MSTSFKRSAALAAAVLATAASASVVIHESLEAMAQRVPLVVRGRVTRSQATWDHAQRRISTWTEVVVTETLKGPARQVLLVQQPGGEVGPIGQAVAGTAKFREGEDCLLFLEPAPGEKDAWRVSGLAAGKVSFTQWRGKAVALRDLEGLAFAAPGGGGVVPVSSPELLGSPEALLARIRAAVRGGAR